jgi:hypothetical protein
MKNKVVKAVIFLVIMSAVSTAQATLMLIVNNGILMGARDVLVGDTLYDVDFLDGTCIEFYSGCDDSSDFIFNTIESATLAAIALRDTVFLDVAEGTFDSAPWLTNGCTTAVVYWLRCQSFTPYANEVSVEWGGEVAHSIFGNGTGDGIYSTSNPRGETVGIANGYDRDHDFGDQIQRHVAVWSVSATASVPEPSTVILLSLGLAGLFMSHHRKQY